MPPGPAEVPEGLFEYARGCLLRDLRATDGETAIVSIEDATSAEGVTMFTDDAGRTYRATFLTTLVDDVPRHAAIAVLADAPGDRRAVDFALTSALAKYMIDAGDTPGVAARD